VAAAKEGTAMIEITYTNGSNATVPTLAEAVEQVRTHYPDAVFYDDSGWEVIYGAPCGEIDLQREGTRMLAWEDAAASENDDGARAVASLRYATE
jgi:hypothetical protein